MERDRALTLAGGGSRCFYQLGLWSKWGRSLEPRLAGIAACSAGACVAALALCGREKHAMEFWKIRRRHIDRNFEWERLLTGRRPTPQYPVYRDTLLHAFEDGGLERLRSLPFPLLVLASAPPKGVPKALATLTGFGAYALERYLHPHRVHRRFGRRLGFAPLVVDARTCETADELIELIIASSATPPFTPVGYFRGQALLDGGIVDGVPAFVGDTIEGAKKNLVLLTRFHQASRTGDKGRRFYLAPSAPVPVDTWDYSRPDLVDQTYALGLADADRYQDQFDQFLSSP